MERVEKKNVSNPTVHKKPVMDQGDRHENDVTEVFHFGAVQNRKGRYAIGLNSYVSKLV